MSRYELVFTELEDCLDNEKSLFGFDIPGMRVSKNIKEDLDLYYGKARKLNSPAVDRYCYSTILTLLYLIFSWVDAIREARKTNSTLLASHIYQMYLGLHSGAKILRKRYSLEGKTLDLNPSLKVWRCPYETSFNNFNSDQGRNKA